MTSQAVAAQEAPGEAPTVRRGRQAIGARPAAVSHPAPRDAGVSHDVITQAELEELTALERRHRAIAADWKARSRAMRDRLEAGAAVQAGPHRARLTQSTERRPTFGALERLYGAGFVRELSERLEVRRYTSLKLSGPR